MTSYRLSADLGQHRERFALPLGSHLIGSDAECDLRLVHPTVSRRHARLVVDADGPTIEDLGSTNGTFLGNERVQDRTPLVDGSTLRFGSVAASIESMSAGDLEVAVRLAAPATAPESRSPEANVTAGAGDDPTASLGSLRDLVIDHLPRWLDLLGERSGAIRMAQAVGDGLLHALPCLAVEIVDVGATEALLFTAHRTAAEPPPGGVTRGVEGPLEVRISFAHPTQAQAFAPLADSAVRLIAFASGQRRSAAIAPPGPSPPLPEPATVVPTVRRIYEQAARVAAGDVSVLIQGESGTGKEVLARYLHAASPRHAGPFVALNCAALPRDLLEAELFGIEEKVATGVAPRPGKFELADGGTLFLDEIGDMAPETQARILRVLQEGEVFRIGGSRPRAANVRTLAATNRDLDAMLAEGGFRGDLYHRIADWRVTLPPLRARRADLANLAAHFLSTEAERRGLHVAGISRAALDALCAHDWPGNIRQLQREMARAALFLDDGAVLESRHLDEALRRAAGSTSGTTGRTLRERLTEAERREICRALEETGDDVTAAARLLAVGRSTLYRRMGELGIERPGEGSGATSERAAP